MTVRTTKKTVTFVNSFKLGDFEEVLPPGTYDVETDEERLEGLSFHVYRRILTLIHLPAKSGNPGLSRTLTIDPNELDAALKRNAASGAASPEPAPLQEPSKGTPKPREAETDRFGGPAGCEAFDATRMEANDERFRHAANSRVRTPTRRCRMQTQTRKNDPDVLTPLPTGRVRGGSAGRRVQRGIGE